jgi:hypothetical protein
MGDYYILTSRGSQAADPAEFFAGCRGDERTAAVFTSLERARRFAAGRRNATQIERLDGISLLNWLIGLFRCGMQRVAVDPEQNVEAHQAPTCSLALLLGELGDALAERLHGCTAAGQQSDGDPLVAFRCERCHKIRRQLSHRRAPVCCGRVMQLVSSRHVPERLAMRQP